jgi:hypothetical protein
VLQIPLTMVPKGQLTTETTADTTGEITAFPAVVAVEVWAAEEDTITVLDEELEVEALVEVEVELTAVEVAAAADEVEVAAPPQPMPKPLTQRSLLSRPAPVRSMAAALAVAKRARTGRREYIVYEIGRVGRLT